MPELPNEELKAQVRDFWNSLSCDTQVASSAKFSIEDFEQIEAFRYRDQPFIHAFAQFTRYHKKRVLEVGVGAGTDFIQWLRAGAIASGVDLTPEAVENVMMRISAYQLPMADKVIVADAERLPFDSDSFDLGYSFGVLHHSPDTERALGELVRVIRPGGELKVMLYNRHSVYVFNQWVKVALLKGRPAQSLKSILWNHIESVGTKGYTRTELSRILSELPLDECRVRTEVTSGDYLSASTAPLLKGLYRLALKLSGQREAWHPSEYVERPQSSSEPIQRKGPADRDRQVIFSGNPLGFYHCITARKRLSS